MIDEEYVEKVLKDLEADGLIKKTGEDTYDSTNSLFRIPDAKSLRHYYEYWLDRSKAALDLPMEERKYRSLKFALSKEEYAEILENINEYSITLLSKYQSSSLEGRRLYMYNSTLIPVSKPMEAPTEESRPSKKEKCRVGVMRLNYKKYFMYLIYLA